MRWISPQLTFSSVRESGGYYRASPRYPLTLEPNCRFRGHSPEYEIVVHINAEGRRDRAYPLAKPAGVSRVLCLGDSFTFGQGVGDRETWPKRLEEHMGFGVQAWNLGYTAGFSPDSYALFAREEMAALAPDVVVVQLFLWNDVDDLRHNVWDELAPDGFPRRIRSPLNFIDADGRRLWEANYPLRLRIPVLRESHLFQLAARVVTWSDGMGRPLSSDDYSRRVHRAGWPEPLAGPWDRLRRSLRELDAATRRCGARLLVVAVPTLLQLEDRTEYRRVYLDDPAAPYDAGEPERTVLAFLAAEGIPALDLAGPFREGMAAGRWTPASLYYPVDGHLTPLGHQVMAEAVAGVLSGPGWLHPSVDPTITP